MNLSGGGPGAELHHVFVEGSCGGAGLDLGITLIEFLQPRHQPFVLALHETKPSAVCLLGFRQDLNFNEVLVGLEEGKLFEQSFPRESFVLLCTRGYQSLSDHSGFLILGQESGFGRLRHTMGRVSCRESRCNNWHYIVVRLLVK